MTKTIRSEIYYDGVWNAVEQDTRAANPAPNDGISITRGRADERGSVSGGSCRTVFNNDGTYSRRNASSSLFGKIGQNTPYRARVEGVFDSPAIRGSVTATAGAGVVLGGTKPTGVVAGDVLLCFHTADTATLDDIAGPSLVGPPFTDWELLDEIVTGTNSLATRVWWRVAGGGDESTIVVDQTASSDGVVAVIALSGASHARPKISITSEVPPGATILSPDIDPEGDNDFEIRWVAMSDAVGAANTWGVVTDCTERVDSQSNTFTSAQMVTRALSSGAATGTKTHTPTQTGFDWAHAVTVTVMADQVRFAGEIPEWPPQWDVTGRDRWVEIEAAGPMRRLTQGARSLRSALYREITRGLVPTNAVGYWPLEDAGGTNQLASGLPGVGPMYAYGTALTFHSDAIMPGSDETIVLKNGAKLVAEVPDYGTDGQFTVCALFSIPTSGIATQPLLDVRHGASAILSWSLFAEAGDTLRFKGFSGAILVHDSGALSFDLSGGSDNRPQLIGFTVEQSGTSAAYTVFQYVLNSDGTLTLTTATGSFASTTVGFVNQVVVAIGANLNADIGVGHVLVSANTFPPTGGFLDALVGWAGETAGRRFERLCFEEGITFNYHGDLDLTPAMGPQPISKLLDLLQECQVVDQGVMHESRSRIGIVYRTLSSLYNQTPVEISESSGHFSPPFRPVDDDQLTHNWVEVKRPGGSSFVAKQDTGPLNIGDPATDAQAAGIYDRGAKSANVQFDSQLPDVAGWLLNLGTVDEARYPNLNIELARSVHAPAGVMTALAKQIAALETGSLVSVADLPATQQADDSLQLIQGYSETLTKFLWTLGFNASPGSPYTVGIEGTARADTSGTELGVAVNSSATSLKFVSDAYPNTLWSEAAADLSGGFAVKCGGEKMTVTAMSHTAWTFVGAGTAAHADNGSVSPSIHASSATGDLILVLVAIRSTNVGVSIDALADYETVYNHINLALFAKIHDGSEASPAITFTGGAVGDTTSAHCATFRSALTNVENLAVRVHPYVGTGVATQNIPAASMPVDEDNCLIIAAGWKGDDWTSVATLSGFTAEIGEPSSVLGSDQGIVWDYLIQTTKANVSAPTFTVTGGVTALTHSIVALFRYDTQTATVTRSVNGVSKAHSAGDAISLWSPARIGK